MLINFRNLKFKTNIYVCGHFRMTEYVQNMNKTVCVYVYACARVLIASTGGGVLKCQTSSHCTSMNADCLGATAFSIVTLFFKKNILSDLEYTRVITLSYVCI
jgi:hypothetical protein